MECYTTHLEWIVIFLSLQHFIAPALDLMACLPSQQSREAIKALHPIREQSTAAKNEKFLPNTQCCVYSFVDPRLMCPEHEMFFVSKNHKGK